MSKIVDVSTLSQFSQIKQKFYRIIGTETFKQSYKILLFSSCFDEIEKYIFSGRNIAIDEGSIESEKDFEIFHYCFGYYKEVKKALFFNKIEDTLIKCMIRNNKFADSLNGSSCKNMQEFTVTDVIKKDLTYELSKIFGNRYC